MKVIKAPVVFENAAGKRVAEITEEGEFKVLRNIVGYASNITNKKSDKDLNFFWMLFVILFSMVVGAAFGITIFNHFFV